MTPEFARQRFSIDLVLRREQSKLPRSHMTIVHPRGKVHVYPLNLWFHNHCAWS